ncbi:pantetheine-phosphate adenylyltransferase [Chitinimonas sp. BJYL2]|uniref:pantetheine-phosphate adenylyltransferase n=1 Tax=Chitinimonas sp. BJYL2 TaxID=2976696 RepID=UPI0022B38E01|nr:pantetheine-phosphate adenylyltransferase [Chitinimonas sp. BJYL2]
MKRAVYAGSFDPVTNGHLWMIERGYELFDEMIVAIGINPDKRATFNVEERVEMLREVTQHLPDLKVTSFENQFLVNYARSVDAHYILRGIRNPSDYEFERTMRYINSDLVREVTTIFLMPPRSIAEVSSTMIKGLIGPEGWEEVLKQYVPEPVRRRFLDMGNRV